MNYTDSDIQAIVDTQVELKTKELKERIDKALTLLKTFYGSETIINDVIDILQYEEEEK